MKIDIEALKNIKLFLATPMYGGQCYGTYTKSILELNNLCSSLGIGFQFYFLFNESLISRARNYIADAFMRSDATHLLFLDSDISFNAQDVLALASLAITRDDIDVVCGPYPKKNISWEKIRSAVDKGLADQDPNELENYVGDFVINFAKEGNFNMGEPIEVSEAGTGFMLIPRETFEAFDAAYPEMKYSPDHLRNKDFNGNREISAYFMDYIDQEEKRHLSEDYMFCKWLRKIDRKIWVCPWMQISHTGTYTYKGDLVKVVSAGLSATMNKSKG